MAGGLEKIRPPLPLKLSAADTCRRRNIAFLMHYCYMNNKFYGKVRYFGVAHQTILSLSIYQKVINVVFW